MTAIGRVESLWRYPVKSMAGEALDEAFAGYSGLYGDRLYAFKSSLGDKGFPYFTGREQARMLCFRPRFRDPARAAKPGDWPEAAKEQPSLNPCFDDPDGLELEVVTPTGEVMAIGNPALPGLLTAGLDEGHALTLMRSDRAFTDCRPLSLISRQTVEQLGAELGQEVDHRRFRANIYLDLGSDAGFAEDAFVGQSFQIGDQVKIAVVDRDPRCKMITLDPDTGEMDAKVLQKVGRGHDGRAGVYGVVLQEGLLRPGDAVTPL
jgi:uncharacterized protein YcbX